MTQGKFACRGHTRPCTTPLLAYFCLYFILYPLLYVFLYHFPVPLGINAFVGYIACPLAALLKSCKGLSGFDCNT